MTEIIKRSSGSYFRIMAIVILVIAVGGFTMFDIKHMDTVAKPYPLLVFHALTMVGWFVVFVIQTQLVHKNKLKAHIKYGLLSIWLALAMVITGMGVAYHSYVNKPEPIVVAFSFATLISFSTAYFIGYRYRKHQDVHKRAMLLAGMGVLPPAIGRATVALNLPMPVFLLLYVLLILSVIIYDMKTRKRPHKVSVLLGLMLILLTVGALVIGPTETWGAFVSKIWG